jgi:hypothetical protein
VEQPSDIRTTQRVKPELPITVLFIFHDQQGLVEKDLLGFRLADIVFIDTFPAAALIPVKPFDLEKVKHGRILRDKLISRAGIVASRNNHAPDVGYVRPLLLAAFIEASAVFVDELDIRHTALGIIQKSGFVLPIAGRWPGTLICGPSLLKICEDAHRGRRRSRR